MQLSVKNEISYSMKTDLEIHSSVLEASTSKGPDMIYAQSQVIQYFKITFYQNSFEISRIRKVFPFKMSMFCHCFFCGWKHLGAAATIVHKYKFGQ